LGRGLLVGTAPDTSRYEIPRLWEIWSFGKVCVASVMILNVLWMALEARLDRRERRYQGLLKIHVCSQHQRAGALADAMSKKSTDSRNSLDLISNSFELCEF
jgi:hypothetical protein